MPFELNAELYNPSMKDYFERLDRPEMTYYRETYDNSPKWDGSSLAGKRILVYCEQGMGDTIQFSRYFKYLDGHVTLHCQAPLMELMMGIEGVDAVCDKLDDNLPDHDCHTLSLSLPFLLKRVEATLPYIRAWANPEVMDEDGFKVGICWEGSPDNKMNLDRSCPLAFFKDLPGKKFMLQSETHLPQLQEGCDEMELFGVEITDMKDTASLIAAMDVVVSVDTAVLHLSAAMGKPTMGLLCRKPDARWSVWDWYDTLELFSQEKAGEWNVVFEQVKTYLKVHHGERIKSISETTSRDC
jgi:hypothetical protein